MTDRYYSSEQTDRSFAVLGEVVNAVPDAVLIGGWASWVRTGGPMSHDIDLIVTRTQLAVLQQLTDDMSESRHLAGRKWRATWNGIHLDLYVPFESRLGLNLQLRVEAIASQTETVDRYQLLVPEAHLATKIAALLDRPDSQPGQKDRLEIRRLLAQPKVAERTPAVIHAASTRNPAELAVLARQAVAYLAESTDVAKSERQTLLRLRQLWTNYFETANPAELSMAMREPPRVAKSMSSRVAKQKSPPLSEHPPTGALRAARVAVPNPHRPPGGRSIEV